MCSGRRHGVIISASVFKSIRRKGYVGMWHMCGSLWKEFIANMKKYLIDDGRQNKLMAQLSKNMLALDVLNTVMNYLN